MTPTLIPRFHVEFLEQNHKHFYRIRGEPQLYASVTNFLNMVGGAKSKALQHWAKNQAINYISERLKQNIGKKVKIDEDMINKLVEAGKQQPDWNLKKAADIGTKVHLSLDDWIVTGKEPQMDEQTRFLFNNFLAWLKEHKMKFILPDTSVVYKGQDGFEYGGRFDAVVEDENGKLLLVDFKSSNHIVEDYALQLSFYYYAFKYTYDVELDGAMIVRFDKEKPEFEVKKISKEKILDNFEVCKALVTLTNGFEKGVWS